MARVRIDTDAMANTDTNIHDALSQTAQLLIDMRGEVEELGPGVWEGANHDDFMESFEDRKDAVKLHGLALEKFAESFSAALKLYQQLEEEVAQVVSNLN